MIVVMRMAALPLVILHCYGYGDGIGFLMARGILHNHVHVRGYGHINTTVMVNMVMAMF